MIQTIDGAAKVARLSAGNVHYRESGEGEGEPIVFVHGFACNSVLWDGVAAELDDSMRCILPDWPMGSHPEAMDPDADVSPPAVAALIAEFLERLGLNGVTIVGNDSGGAVSQILVTEHPERIGRLVLTNCDAFETYPPGHFKLMSRAARLPGSAALLAGSMRIGAIRRSPLAYGWLTERPAPEAALRAWVDPLINDRGVRRDGIRFFSTADTAQTMTAAAKLRDLQIPALLVWGDADRWFTMDLARRLQNTIPDCTLIEVPGGKTYVPFDRPREVAAAVADFVV